MKLIRQYPELTDKEAELIVKVKDETAKKNVDNIARTKAYLDYYLAVPEITWAFLASMVSRNGGYNMCDLQGEWLPKIIDSSVRQRLFLTFERANWLIFRDAYPQLLLYYYSTKINAPMFHLLGYLDVSQFMEREWMLFWEHRDQQRLMTALIVNEQNVIQKPVIEHHVFRKRVFNTFLFFFEDAFHFSTVLFPTCEGQLYGASVNGFKSPGKRIDLGRRLADILFDARYYPSILEFAINTEHTASRHDYERYFQFRKKRDTPFLRCTYPVIEHNYHQQGDWYKTKKYKWNYNGKSPVHRHPVLLTGWYLKKQKQLQALAAIKQLFN
ncbi:DUF2515 domain-containing protein [Bacillus sp. REN3]|uniref:DUF2515 domain-containing protein n=1 Tax=Bacillus sp. REN3 TaxID=2802440 RepID=UPI001AEED2E4|nr:DUF2515 domain-containing protein [Bacillus sp. REN3]